MALRFSGRVALIAGGAGGIGRAVACLLAKEGARVLVADRRAEAAAEAAAAIGPAAQALTLEVTDEDAWSRALDVADGLGGPDIVVAAAGVAHAAPLVDLRLSEWRRVMAVNLDGAFLAVRAGLRAMREHGRGGAVVVVSSASGLKAVPNTAAYGAGKAALGQLVRVAALEGAPDRVRVNAVVPSGVETPMWEGMPFFRDLRDRDGEAAAYAALSAQTPLRRFAKAEEVAEAIAYLASDAAAYVTGTELVIDGGYTAG